MNTKQQYLELNNNSQALNKDRIVKHFLSYFQDVMSEIEDRDVDSEIQHVKDLSLVISHLSDLDTLVERVETLQSQDIIDKDSTIIDECISGSNCVSYDYDTDEEKEQYYQTLRTDCKKSEFKIVTIDKEDRSVIVRYNSEQEEDIDVKVIFHESDDEDYENYERLTDKQFKDLKYFVLSNREVNEAFPVEDCE